MNARKKTVLKNKIRKVSTMCRELKLSKTITENIIQLQINSYNHPASKVIYRYPKDSLLKKLSPELGCENLEETNLDL